ncbi:MAG: cysteine desulfurase [Bacteroidetes bacterium]|nr:cysteine desulfurase [Bacteroidota bacterium]
MRTVYLDHSATTPVAPEVIDAMTAAFRDVPGNASSVHAYGRRAKTLLEESRESLAGALGVSHEEVFFTSGGTESDNSALRGVLAATMEDGKDHLIVSVVEHHAVLAAAERLEGQGVRVTVLPVDADGLVSADSIRAAFSSRTALVSVMHANNEVGTVQPIGEIARIAHDHGAAFHTDAVQSFGKLPFDLREVSADLVSLTAHKLYGPKGIGAMVVRKGTPYRAQVVGGAQEMNRRAGTENVPLAAGFAKAVSIASVQRMADATAQEALRERLLALIRRSYPNILVNGHPTTRLHHILSVSFPWDDYAIDGEALIAGMDLRGVAVTSGSACTSGTLQASHVLMAMGRDERTARATVRFSLGRSTTEDDIDYAAEALQEVVRMAKGRGAR